jgi:hypothetical protein
MVVDFAKTNQPIPINHIDCPFSVPFRAQHIIAMSHPAMRPKIA